MHLLVMPTSSATVPSFPVIISENPRHNKRNSESRITSRHRGHFTEQSRKRGRGRPLGGHEQISDHEVYSRATHGMLGETMHCSTRRYIIEVIGSRINWCSSLLQIWNAASHIGWHGNVNLFRVCKIQIIHHMHKLFLRLAQARVRIKL